MPLRSEPGPLFGLLGESGHANVAQRSPAQCVTRGHVQRLLPAGTVLIRRSHWAPSCNNSLHSTTVTFSLDLNLFCGHVFHCTCKLHLQKCAKRIIFRQAFSNIGGQGDEGTNNSVTLCFCLEISVTGLWVFSFLLTGPLFCFIGFSVSMMMPRFLIWESVKNELIEAMGKGQMFAVWSFATAWLLPKYFYLDKALYTVY